VYSNPRYSSPQRSNLRRLPSLDRLPSRAASNSTVNAPSVVSLFKWLCYIMQGHPCVKKVQP
jgi:hypothetical protein